MRRRTLTSWIVAGVLLGAPAGAQDIELQTNETRWRITYEEFESKPVQQQ